MSNSSSHNVNQPAFIADCHLGKVSKYLRLLGFDTLYFNQIDDDMLLEMARSQNRLILTRDRELCERGGALCQYLYATTTEKQLTEVVDAQALRERARPFSRCLVCNAPLVSIDKNEVADRVPPKVYRFFDTFDLCPQCDKVYWHGDHYRKMASFVKMLLN